MSALFCYLGRGHRKRSHLLEHSIGDTHQDRQSNYHKTDLMSFNDRIHVWNDLRFVTSYNMSGLVNICDNTHRI